MARYYACMEIFRNIIVVFLILTIASAVLSCLYAGTMPIGHGSHDSMTGNSNVFTHIAHAKQIISIPVSAISLIVAVVLSVAIFVLASFHKKLELAQIWLVFYSRLKDSLAPRIAKQKIDHWLSRFERSPEYLVPA